MIAANVDPFSSSEIFFAAEVLPSKNASQFAVIAATEAELPAVPEPELTGAGEPTAAADEAAAEGDPGLVADVLELLLQAATVTARARPSAGAAIRRATRFNRMTRLLCLGRMYC
jgi:hypothetical protein